MVHGISPKRSPSTERVLKRRRDIEKSESAAYWAIGNTLGASFLYYDLCYIQLLADISILLVYLEWLACFMLISSALYDLLIHFWSHTFMKPIVVSPAERKLLGIHEDEFGFRVEETPKQKFEPVFDNLPPFEIQNLYEEEKKVVTPQRANYSSSSLHSPDNSMNASRRSKVTDKESLVEYLKKVQIFEDEMAELREAEMKHNHSLQQ